MVPSNLSQFLVRIPRNLDKYDGDLAANTINQQSSTNPVVTYHQSQISVLWNIVSFRKVDNHSSVMSFMTTKTAIVSNFTKKNISDPELKWRNNDTLRYLIKVYSSDVCFKRVFVLILGMDTIHWILNTDLKFIFESKISHKTPQKQANNSGYCHSNNMHCDLPIIDNDYAELMSLAIKGWWWL